MENNAVNTSLTIWTIQLSPAHPMKADAADKCSSDLIEYAYSVIICVCYVDVMIFKV